MQKAKFTKHEKTMGDVVRSKYLLPLLQDAPGIVLDIGTGGTPKGDVNVDINREWWNWYKGQHREGYEGMKGYFTKWGDQPIPNFVLADGTALPFKEAVFSSVVGSDLLEHIENDTQALSEMRRVLKPGGRVILHTPNKDQTHIIQFRGKVNVCNAQGEKETLTFGEQEEHVRPGYSSDELRTKLKLAGFSEIAISATFNIVECLAWEWDRFIVFEAMCSGIDPRTATVFPIRLNNLVYIQNQMRSFDPESYKNLAWLVVAK